MTSITATEIRSTTRARIGWVLTGLVSVFLAVDSVTHLLAPPYIDTAMDDLGWPRGTAPVIGALMAIGLVLHLAPRTRVIGLLVVTGYLGGAVGAQVRIESGVANAAFPALVAAVLWAGLALRDDRVRRMLFPASESE